jgi:hypothetical protein
MPSLINSDDGVVSGTSGLKTTGGNDGLLNIQTNGSTAMSVNASQQVTFNNGANLPNTFGFKNRLINGGMVIDQRNAGASVTQGTSNTYCLDRWLVVGSQASKFTIQQNTADAPTANGFATCAKITSSSAYSVGASEVFFLIQKVEGFNQTDIGWGTAGAQPVTLSFLVRSSLTGTFGGCLINSAETYTFPFSYTINAANTWETKTITIPAQTAGAWNNNSNSIGIQLVFSMGCGTSLQATANTWTTGSKYAPTGATNIVGTNGATFYITGVQLERGSTATSFDFRSYGTELQLCQRYYYRVYGTQTPCSGTVWSTSLVLATTRFPVTMRTNPTALEQSGTAAHYNVLAGGVVTTCNGVPTLNSAGDTFSVVAFATGATLVAGQGAMGNIANTSGYLGWSAEL